MENLVEDINGLIHLQASIIALISGTMVLLLKKGTKRHKQIGYVYVLSMGILIITAFLIYRLFNGWGVFHYAAILSLLLIGFGMIPVWTKKPTTKWKYQHFSFMYWSVIALYAAFMSEVFTRIPETPFFGMVGVATAVILIGGGIGFIRNKSRWTNQFNTREE